MDENAELARIESEILTLTELLNRASMAAEQGDIETARRLLAVIRDRTLPYYKEFGDVEG